MSDLMIDLSNYKDRRGSRVPEGRYKVRIIDIEATKSTNDNNMLNVIFEIVEGQFAGNTLVDRYMPENEKVLFRLVGLMQAIGLPTPRKRLALKQSAFLNKLLYVVVQDGNPYQGIVRSEVRGWEKVEAMQEDGEGDDWGSDSDSGVEETPAESQNLTPRVKLSQASDNDQIDLEELDSL